MSLGHVAKAQIVRAGQGGDGLAPAGLVIGYIGLLLTAFLPMSW